MSSEELDITAEELERIKHRKSTTPLDERDCCPACGSVNIAPRIGRNGEGGPGYRCTNGDCLNWFDQPANKGEFDAGN